ncbi:ATPase, T2SS/T4P/T4SS family [Dyella mobilis]|uniref:Flp pilus assembly complex ATPase component TadA n=1 Tax=Dyella mobilis TaxID=1849582 RepID=A0ABS2KK35_9GAMM|nr:ATPase, T2SS/T4P/T4SS family [Dyella mobilis]MBM7131526.1 Flp pilus assembly complex ATPase component TadA [Dyella mobilis]GLQ96503.1 secretory protein [Dyella mobilis]
MFEVLIETPNRDKRQVRCLHDVCVIGRGDDNLVILQGWNIAREHAALRLRQGAVFIEVLGGRAPVAVNGERIQDVHGPLLRDDIVTIGAYRLRVLVDKAETAPLKVPREAANASSHLADAPPASSPSPPPMPVAAAREPEIPAQIGTPNPEMLEWRTKAHLSLVKQMDLRRVDVRGMTDDDLREKTAALIEEIIGREFDAELPASIDRTRLAKEVLDEAIGLGPLEDLIADESVTEIMVNRSDEIFIERAGRIEKSSIIFTGDKAVLAAIERIVAPLGRRIDESSPMVDARLADGSRVNAVIPPIALRGPSISIRKFSKRKLMGEDLLKFGSIDEPMLEFVQMAVRERKNIVVTGGTGSGKTTLLNILSNFIPDEERIVTIEDAAELKLSQPNLVSLEARPANLEGKGIITIRDLVRNALRMRPDRIVVGECRGGEALDMLQAMNTGHEGSLTTAHANSPRDALSRLEVMVLMSNMDLPMVVVREQIASAVDLIIHQRRFPCGSRKVTHIWEITGIESGTIQTQELFSFRARDQGGPGGRVRGEFSATGAVPEFYEELADRGVPVDLSIFKPAGGKGHE